MAIGFSYRVYYGNIRGLYRRDGPGGGWIYRVSRDMMREAKVAAPKRSRALVNAHSITRGRGVNQYAATYNVVNSADHAEYVHFGTAGNGAGWIYPSSKRALVLPARSGYGRVVAKRVHGQKANPWLDDACTRVAIRYGGVPIG